jgi:hypothetical protein
MVSYVENQRGQENLRRLRDGDFTLWNKEEIENLPISPISKDISFYTARMNSFKCIPSTLEIKKKYKLGVNTNLIRLLTEREILVDITIPDILKFYNINPSPRRDCFPENLKWLRVYVERKNTCRSRGATFSWKEKKENPRAPVFSRHYVVNLVDEKGLPYYLPLGLHVKK